MGRRNKFKEIDKRIEKFDPNAEILRNGFDIDFNDVRFTLYRTRMRSFIWRGLFEKNLVVGYDNNDEVNDLVRRLRDKSEKFPGSMFFEIINFTKNSSFSYVNDKPFRSIHYRKASSLQRELTRIHSLKKIMIASSHGMMDYTRRSYIPVFILPDQALSSSHTQLILDFISESSQGVFPFFFIKSVSHMPHDLLAAFDVFVAIGEENSFILQNKVHPHKRTRMGTPKREWIGVGYTKGKSDNFILHPVSTWVVSEYGQQVREIREQKMSAYKDFLKTIDTDMEMV